MDQLGNAIAHFNALAERHGWGQFCDPDAGFVLPECAALIALWDGARQGGALPRRDALTARLLKPFLPRLVLIEKMQTVPPRMRFRLVGTTITQTLSERTGQFFDDPTASERQTARWTQSMLLALGAGRPLRFYMRDQVTVTGELLCLPLADETGEARFVLGYGCYDPLRDWNKPAPRLSPRMAAPASPAG